MKLRACLSLSDLHVVRLQVGELRINELCVGSGSLLVQESVHILAAVPRLSIRTVCQIGVRESIAILDALAPIAGSVVCCDLSGFR